MEPAQKISVVIPSYNGLKWLRQCLPSVLESEYENFEIMVVDNGSNDGTAEYLREVGKENPAVRMIRNEGNLGWSPATAQGFRESQGEILVGLSNDMEVDSVWLKEAMKVFESSAKVGMVQFYSLSMWDRTTPDSARNFLDRFGYAYAYQASQQPARVFVAEGMAFAIRKSAYEFVGGFDESFFMEYDDMDLSWRVILAGYDVVFSPAAKVFHARGGTVGATYFTRKLDNIQRYTKNHLVTISKNASTANLLFSLPVVFAMELGKAAYFLIAGETNISRAIAEGLLSFAEDITATMEKRRTVQRQVRRVSEKEVLVRMVPFQPVALYLFLKGQGAGKRLVLKSDMQT